MTLLTSLLTVSMLCVQQPPPRAKTEPIPRPTIKPKPKAKAERREPRKATGPRKATRAKKGAAKKQPGPTIPPPNFCKKPTDTAADVLKAAVTVLAAEANKRKHGDMNRGLEALEALLAERRAEVLTARKTAKKMNASLSKEQRSACEDYAFHAMNRALTGLRQKQAFYYDRVAVFRLLGDLFR